MLKVILIKKQGIFLVTQSAILRIYNIQSKIIQELLSLMTYIKSLVLKNMRHKKFLTLRMILKKLKSNRMIMVILKKHSRVLMNN